MLAFILLFTHGLARFRISKIYLRDGIRQGPGTFKFDKEFFELGRELEDRSERNFVKFAVWLKNVGLICLASAVVAGFWERL
jgi:hypothetical protein